MKIINNHTELFWYSPNDCLPHPTDSVMTVQRRANGELIYAFSFYNDDVKWFTEDQGFSKQPVVVAWTYLPKIQRFINQERGQKFQKLDCIRQPNVRRRGVKRRA